MNPDPADDGRDQTIRNEALAWFARLRDEPVSPADLIRFHTWFHADPRHAEAYELVQALWQAQAFDAALSRYADEIPPPISRQWPRWVATLILLSTGWAVLSGSGWLDRWRADYTTAAGEQRRVVLADGSTVFLNTDSAMVVDFGGERRGVHLLTGEAFFDVQPDSARPFQVQTRDASVRVLGTRFSVRAAEATEVAVDSGLVACANRRGDDVQLRRGEKASVSHRHVGAPEPVDTARDFAWLKGRLVFKERPLAEVIREIDRYHPGAIVVANAAIGQMRMTGNYRLDDTDAIVRALAGIAGGRVFTLSRYLTVVR